MVASGGQNLSFDKASVAIGATGMLAQATLWLASRSPKTLVVARQASLFVAGTSGMLACDADWNQGDFAAKLEAALDGLGPVGQVLLWLHDNQRHLPQLLPLLGSGRTVLVLGSTDGRPQIPPDAVDLITVRLGRVHTAGRAPLADA